MTIKELCFRKTCENGSKKLIDKAENNKNNNEPNSLNFLKTNDLQRLTAYRLFQ
jgi:hypothetical protein